MLATDSLVTILSSCHVNSSIIALAVLSTRNGRRAEGSATRTWYMWTLNHGPGVLDRGLALTVSCMALEILVSLGLLELGWLIHLEIGSAWRRASEPAGHQW